MTKGQEVRTTSVNLDRSSAITHGITMGTALAIVASWSVNESIVWGILHGVLSWAYVIYFGMAY